MKTAFRNILCINDQALKLSCILAVPGVATTIFWRDSLHIQFWLKKILDKNLPKKLNSRVTFAPLSFYSIEQSIGSWGRTIWRKKCQNTQRRSHFCYLLCSKTHGAMKMNNLKENMSECSTNRGHYCTNGAQQAFRYVSISSKNGPIQKIDHVSYP